MPLFRLYVGYCLQYRPRLKRVDFTSTVLIPESAYVTFEFSDRESAVTALDAVVSATEMAFADACPDAILVVVDGDTEIRILE